MIVVQYVEVKGDLFYFSKAGQIYCNTMSAFTNLKRDETQANITKQIKNQFGKDCEFIKVKKFDKS